MRSILTFSLAVLVFASCEVKPQPINYGSDSCHFCKMTIVDNQHAAQTVTVKGRAYKYDAIECMMNHLNQWDQPEIKYYLVTNHAKPGELVDAKNAHYLISEAIPSPMGAFLSAFEDPTRRDSILDEEDGESLDWDQLKMKYELTN